MLQPSTNVTVQCLRWLTPKCGAIVLFYKKCMTTNESNLRAVVGAHSQHEVHAVVARRLSNVLHGWHVQRLAWAKDERNLSS